MGLINKGCYTSNVEPDERNPDRKRSRSQQASCQETWHHREPPTCRKQKRERERERERERWKCHTVHPIKMTSTEIRSHTTGLCMSTKLEDIKLFYHFELHYA